MKLSVRIPLIIGAIVLVTIASIIFTVQVIVTREMETATYNQLASNAEANAALLQTKLDAMLGQLWEIAYRIRTRSMDWSIVRPSLMNDVERLDTLDIGLVYLDGTANYVTDDATAWLGDRDYIINAFAGKGTVSDVLISRVTNQPVVMLASPIYQTDEKGAPIVGALIARKDGGTFLANLVAQIKTGYKTGYGYLINYEGTVAAHPNTELVLSQFNPIKEVENDPSLKNLADMVSTALKEKSGYATYYYEGKDRIAVFTEIPGHRWKLVQVVEKDEAMSQVLFIRNIMLVIGAACGVLGIIVAIIIGRSIAKPIVQIAAMMEDIGKGDLTQSFNLDSKDEIGDLSRNMNTTLENIKSLIVIIKKESDILSGIGATLAGNTNKTATAAGEIANTIQTIKERVVNQSASVTETNATVEQISLNIDKLNEHIESQSTSVSESSSAIEQMLANIQSVTQTLIKNADNVKALMDSSELGRSGLQDVAADIQEIARESEGLLEINLVMENISSQTNLLSMNAAIEAAHAGEAGKGFAVVSDEIRKLAENSGEQSKTISSVLGKIKGSIDKIISSTDDVLGKFESIDGGVRIVSDQEENIRNAMEEQGEGSKQILEAIGLLNEVTQQVRDGSQEMLQGSKEIMTEGKNLETATQEITIGMTEVEQDAGKINIAINEVNEISGQNKEVIDNLVIAVSRFKVD